MDLDVEGKIPADMVGGSLRDPQKISLRDPQKISLRDPETHDIHFKMQKSHEIRLS